MAEDQPLSEYIYHLIKLKKCMKIGFSEKYLSKNGYSLLRPIDLPEAWAAGVTYKRQAIEHDKDLKKKGKNEDLYYYVYKNERVEIFFKGLSRSIVGPGEKLWLRSDSTLVMPEAELVLIIGKKGMPVAYTLGNDLTAWDIESECPLYLSQAKIWNGSGSIGPWIVPIETIGSPYSFDLKCIVKRNNEIVLEASGSTSELKRSIEELCYYVNLSNKVLLGSVLFTGTTCVIDHKFGLKKKDVIEISNPLIGNLINEINIHPIEKKNYIKRNEE